MTADCPSGKVAYPSPQAAHAALGHIQRRPRRRRTGRRRHDSEAAYRCTACGAWHLVSKGLRR